MEEPRELLLVAALLATLLAYRQFLVFTRDVPLEYLHEQSVVESTRNPNESAIHKSTKLDYSQGLRVGLAIRYHHYKLRNGNLYDIWELTLANSKHTTQTISVGDESIEIPELHSRASQLKKLLGDAGITELCIPHTSFISSVPVLSLVIACFISQITVHVFESSSHITNSAAAVVEPLDGTVRVIVNGKELLNMAGIEWMEGTTDYTNEYTFEKDRGIALRVSASVLHNTHTTTDFTQSNLVSAVASCSKHLPLKERFGPSDLLAIVLNQSKTESVTNSIVKLLTGMMFGSSVLLADPGYDFMAKQPTIVSAEETVILKLHHDPRGIDRLLYWHRMVSLFCLRFSSLAVNKPYPKLRLLYAHKTIGKGDYSSWNSTRAALSAFVIEEYGYFNVAGPLLVTDLYDFRLQKQATTNSSSGFGCIVQANEMKLLEYSNGQGSVAVRGYNIGKAKRFMHGVGETSVKPDAEGFYDLSISARWGSDGCLYLFK